MSIDPAAADPSSMSVSVARFSGTVGAATWIIGMPLVGLGGLIPSNPEYSSMGVYFLFGVVGVIFGASMATMAVASACDRAQRLWPNFWGWAGAGVGAMFTATSALLVLATLGYVGENAPAWIPDLEVLTSFVVFGWILVASVLGRRSRLGRVALVLGVVTGGTVVGSFALSLILILWFRGFVSIDNVNLLLRWLSYVMWLGLPAWLLAAAWSRTNPPPNEGPV